MIFSNNLSRYLRGINNFAAATKFYLISHILNVAFRLLRTVCKHFNVTKGIK